MGPFYLGNMAGFNHYISRNWHRKNSHNHCIKINDYSLSFDPF